MNQGVASSTEIQELQNLCENMANQITILSRQNNVRRYPYPVIEKAQHVLNENVDQASSFGSTTGLCLACNDAHEQITCPIYQYQEYLLRSGGIPPPGLADDINQDVNLMNFTPTDVGVFAIEIRSEKRPLVFGISKRKVEFQESFDLVIPKKQDAISGSKEKTLEKKTVTQKFLVPKTKPMPKASDQNLRKLRFPSLTKHQRKDDTQQL